MYFDLAEGSDAPSEMSKDSVEFMLVFSD